MLFARGLPPAFGREKDMNGPLISDLHRFVGQPGLEISEGPESVHLLIQRSSFSVSLVVPKSVLEFSVDVHDAEGVRLIEDWLDYAGYDATPEAQLADEMRVEVLTFVARLLDRNLRLAQGGPSLEWQTGERWLQAIPFVPDAEQSLSANAPKESRG
jgi:hypothetical protein